MPTKESLKARIELIESRILGTAVKVMSLKMFDDCALARIRVGGEYRVRTYRYSQFFNSRQLR